ncbi:glycosyltransferase family 1 protein [Actinocrispum sp. NPDC049592]|uniref:glycosyltransferase family 4 protein n=1 Tax=Actinocrispum sp. NPDC049592 TaxID=3154835 RepID=UPI00344721CE
MPELVVLTEQLLAPVPGGTGRYTRELVAAMALNAPAGWTITGVSARHRAAARIPGVEAARMLPLPRKALVAAWEHGVKLWPGGNAVHAPTPLAPPSAKRGTNLVVTIHDTVPFTHPETLTQRGVKWHQAMIRRAANQASAIVVPTAAVAAELTQYAPGAARVHVIGHGVPEAVLRAPQNADAIAHRLNLPPTYVLALGTVEPRKGLDVLVAAMRKPTAPNLPLVIAGPQGWGEVDLGDARVLGRLTDEELAVVLQRATVLAAPSMAEGFGLPVLEAMAVGVPVVHSDAPALVEVAGGTGVLARRNDPASLACALRSVLESPEHTADLVAAAKARAARFTWAKAAEAVWKLHLELYHGAR